MSEGRAADIAQTFHAIGSPVQLMNESQRQALVSAIRQATEAAPALIVVDTLSWCILGADENDSGAMTQLIEATAIVQRQIAEAYEDKEPAALFIHHTGKSKKGMRGAYSLTAATDFVYSLEYDRAAKTARLRTERVKDGPKSKPLVFEMLQVTLMDDEDGQPVTTCVCVPRGYEKGVSRRLSINEQKVVDALVIYDHAQVGTHTLRFGKLRDKTALKDGNVGRALNALTKELGFVTQDESRGYRLTDAALKALTDIRFSGVSEFPSTSPTRSHSHTPLNRTGLIGGPIPREDGAHGTTQ